jgi:hypothetical protein
MPSDERSRAPVVGAPAGSYAQDRERDVGPDQSEPPA